MKIPDLEAMIEDIESQGEPILQILESLLRQLDIGDKGETSHTRLKQVTCVSMVNFEEAEQLCKTITMRYRAQGYYIRVIWEAGYTKSEMYFTTFKLMSVISDIYLETLYGGTWHEQKRTDALRNK